MHRRCLSDEAGSFLSGVLSDDGSIGEDAVGQLAIVVVQKVIADLLARGAISRV